MKSKSKHFEAASRMGAFRLTETGNTVKEIMQIIDKHNEKRIEAGDEAEAMLIVSVVWKKETLDDGTFLSQSKTETALMFYPARGLEVS